MLNTLHAEHLQNVTEYPAVAMWIYLIAQGFKAAD